MKHPNKHFRIVKTQTDPKLYENILNFIRNHRTAK